MFGGDVNYPYRLFELNYDFTLQELKTQYKKMVFRYHPDKASSEIASSHEFRVLTECYRYLLEQLKNKSQFMTTDDRENCHMTLKSMYEREIEQRNTAYHQNTASRKSFNPQKFNQDYDMHRYNDPIASKGYQDFYTRNDPHEDALINKGHNGYDSLAQGPQPLEGIDLSDCYELGGEYKNLGRNTASSKGLHYMDLQLAHTTSKIIDEKNVHDRPTYSSLDQLRIERDRPIELTQNERIEMEIREQQIKEQEERRKQIQYQRDQEISHYHRRTSNILMR